jgi:hypothetical protein
VRVDSAGYVSAPPTSGRRRRVLDVAVLSID